MDKVVTEKKYIDFRKIFNAKNPTLNKFLPNFIYKYVAKIIHEDELNYDLNRIELLKGSEKFTHFLKYKNIDVEIIGAENVPQDGRYIFASNHPLGGPDGIIFVAAVSNFFKDLKFIVNDILMNLPGVEDIFLPINKHGGNPRDYINRIESAYASDSQMLIFPAGMVSRKQKGIIRDLEWQKSFIANAKKYERDIIPVFIDGKNSKFFYNLANFRKRIGIKANIEMFFLIDEFYKHKNETIKIYFGKPISYKTFTNDKSIKVWAQEMKEKTYELTLLHNTK